MNRHVRTCCKNCAWWEEADSQNGVCKGAPPLIVPDTFGILETMWPETNRLDWCGAYRRHERQTDLELD